MCIRDRDEIAILVQILGLLRHDAGIVERRSRFAHLDILCDNARTDVQLSRPRVRIGQILPVDRSRLATVVVTDDKLLVLVVLDLNDIIRLVVVRHFSHWHRVSFNE